jgi:hypothetical protein
MKNWLIMLTTLFGLCALFMSSVGFSSSYGPAYVTSARTSYASTAVGTTTPVQIVASLPSNCSEIDVFDSSGQTLELMLGAAGSERRVRLITPGGNGRVPQALPQGARVSLRALSASASAGEDDFTCLAE